MIKVKNKLYKTYCPICGSKKNFKVLYKTNFSLDDLNDTIFSARRIPDKIHYQLVKCKNDGLVRSNPIADHSVLEVLYKKSKFTYQDETDNLTNTYYQALQKVLKNIDKNSKILEIGCGNGFVLKKLYQHGYKNIYGIEPSIDAKNNADKKIANNIITDILKPKLFHKKSFDFIFFFQTFDHIPNPNEFLKLCYSLLKKGGYILSFNHNINSFSSKILKEKSPIIDIEHTYLYNPQTMKLIFENNKFHTVTTFSPNNIVSLRHLVWLFPLTIKLKKKLLESKHKVLNKIIKIKLGNICYIGQK